MDGQLYIWAAHMIVVRATMYIMPSDNTELPMS